MGLSVVTLVSMFAVFFNATRSYLYTFHSINKDSLVVTLKASSSESSICRFDVNQHKKNYRAMTKKLLSLNNGRSHTRFYKIEQGKQYYFYISCLGRSGKITHQARVISVKIPAGSVDTQGPLISNLSPTGVLFKNTVATSLSLRTNESANCKYSNQNTSFNNMKNMNRSSSGLAHSAILSNLRNGYNYEYYVKCSDAKGNLSIMGLISFRVAK